jgi:hypothetical protein
MCCVTKKNLLYGWQFVFAYQVHIVSKHEYKTIYVNYNLAHLIK